MDTFEITIQRKAADGWPVVVEQAADDGTLPVRSEGMLTLDPAALLPLELEPRPYGMLLGKALFAESVRDAFTSARTTSADDLRVLLEVEAPDLRSLRWERLCAPFGRKWAFLALDQRAPFSLYLPSVTDRRFPPFGRHDLRALVVVASPQGLDAYDLTPFDTAATIAGIRTALGEIPCDVLAADDGSAGPADPRCHRGAHHCRALHPAPHRHATGRCSRSGETVLYLADADGQVDHVSALEAHRPPGRTRRRPRPAASRIPGGLRERQRCGGGGGCLRRPRPAPGPRAGYAGRGGDDATRSRSRPRRSSRPRSIAGCGSTARSTVPWSRPPQAWPTTAISRVPALYSRLGGRPLFSDTGRRLTATEIGSGLDRPGRAAAGPRARAGGTAERPGRHPPGCRRPPTRTR